MGAAERPEAVDQRVPDDELRHRDAVDPVRHDHRNRAGSLRVRGKLPAVARAGKTGNESAARRAGERNEETARFNEAAVLGDEIDGRVRKFPRQAQRTGDFGDGP